MSTTTHIEGVVYKSGDVSQAYLRAEKKFRAHCYKPTLWEYCEWEDAKLAKFRNLLKKHTDPDVMKKMAKPQRFGKALRAKKALYGFPDAARTRMAERNQWSAGRRRRGRWIWYVEIESRLYGVLQVHLRGRGCE
jgi:hypothetical protein